MLPFEYVRKDHYAEWIKSLTKNKQRFWPKQCPLDQQNIPFLMDTEPNSRPLPKPANALPLELAHRVASGEISGKQARMLINIDDDSIYDDEDETTSSAWTTSIDGNASCEFEGMDELLEDLMLLQGYEPC